MTTSAHTCPPIEEIAALLDGRLEAQDRARVMQHLDECPDCYEVFVGTARFLEEEVAPLGGNTAVRRWLPLVAAAALALAVGLPVYRTVLAPPRIGSTDALLRSLEGAAQLQDLWVLEGSRGADETSGHQANSFLIGVWLVDRHISLDLAAPAKAAEFSQQIANSMVAVRMEKQAQPFYLEWKAAAPGKGLSEEDLLRQMMSSDEAEGLLQKGGSLVDLDYLAFGKWAEIVRIAAANRNSELFEDRDIRRFPSYFLNAGFLKEEEEQDSGEEEQDFDATVRQRLQRIDEILDSGDLQPEGFDELAKLLGKGGDEGPGIIKLFEDEAAKAADELEAGEGPGGFGEDPGY